MSFNPANLSYVNSVGGVEYFTYITTDTKLQVKARNYFPTPLVREGDVVIVNANDGDMVTVAVGSPGDVTVVEILAY